MRPATPRKFTLFDACALIAAIAVALVPIRSLYLGGYLEGISQGPVWESFLEVNTMIISLFSQAVGLALGASLVRGPRPKLRRLARQPGASAVICINAYVTFYVFYKLLTILITPLFLHYGFIYSFGCLGIVVLDFTASMPILIGQVVCGAWMVLWLTGAWRAEPNWIDRSGRALGIYWLATMIISAW